MNSKTAIPSLRLKAGELVEVKTKEEILATLDVTGSLEGLPFMPEMFQYCGKQFRIYKRAHKTCDTVFPVRGRRMADAVHLETRCSGEAHGGCQAGCLIFWKEGWLKRVSASTNGRLALNAENGVTLKEMGAHPTCTEDDLRRSTLCADKDVEEPTYVCQATKLPYATTDLKWWDIRQYLEDYRSGNVGILTVLRASLYAIVFRLARLSIAGWKIPDLYDRILAPRVGTPWPLRKGSLNVGQPTPAHDLNLQPGDYVRIKPYEEILRTLNRKSQNRGMSFDKEMVPYCGGVYRVNKRVTRIINEKTGKMQEMKTPCIVLDSVVCQSRFSECRLFCPRSIYSYWREIWLERVEKPAMAVAEGCDSDDRSRLAQFETTTA